MSGSHWIAFYNKKNNSPIEFFDPMGIVPSTAIQAKLKNSGKKVLYNTTQIQDLKSEACGWYCVYYIIMRSKGKSFYDILHQFNTDTKHNDQVLKKLLNQII